LIGINRNAPEIVSNGRRGNPLISGFFAEGCGLPCRKNFDTMVSVSPSTAAVASSPKLLDRVRWHALHPY